MGIEGIEKFLNSLNDFIDGGINTFEHLSKEVTRARINGLQQSLIEDLQNHQLSEISITPQNLYQHLRRQGALTIGRNVFDEINRLKKLGQSPEEITMFLSTNLPDYDENKLAITLTSIKKALKL